jgi:DNA polymerase
MSSEDQISLFSLTESPEPVAPTRANPELIPSDPKIPIPAGTYECMEQLAAHCSQCFRCVLGQTRTNAVIYRGNIQAPLMLIGEGPGQHEDEQGKPFVGKSGQLLDKILQSVNLDVEQDVFICNVVKCRPPENRDPTPQEAEACKGYLFEQIRLVNPKIILLTGKIALRTLLGVKEGITKVRGQWIESGDRLYMPIFHPAYLLRNQSKEKGSPKWLMWQDIQAVRRKLDQILAEEAE